MSEPPDAPPPWMAPPQPSPPYPPYAAPPGWQPAPPPYAAPPGWQPAPPPYAAPPGWQPAPPPYAAPPGWQAPPPYGAPAGWHPYGYPQPRNTNGFAIAALVCSLVGILLAFIGPVLGVVFGIVGLRQTATAGESGRRLAIAGIVIGCVLLLLDIVAAIGLATNHGGGAGGGISV